MFQILESRFWRADNETITDFWVVSQVPKCPDLCWRFQKLWTSSDWQNWQKCTSSNNGTCPRKQKNHYPKKLLRWMRISLASDHNILKNNLNMSAFWQIHALPAEWTACPHESGPSRKAWMTTGIHLKNNNCWIMGLRVLRPGNSHFSAWANYLHTTRGKTCSLPCEECAHCFCWHSYSRALWISSTSSNCKSASLHTLQCLQQMQDKNDNKSVILGSDFSTMTMHLFILLSLHMNFWIETKWLLLHTLPTDTHKHCVTLFFSQSSCKH
jgi:hypothetical protein